MISRTEAATILQRACRERDPIHLGRIRRRFLLYRHGSFVVFDADTLHEYIATTGDTRDPVTREELLSHERMRLERICGASLPSAELLSARHAAEVERRELLSFLCDDVLRSVAVRDEEGILWALQDVHELATDSELRAIYDVWKRNGVRLHRFRECRGGDEVASSGREDRVGRWLDAYGESEEGMAWAQQRLMDAVWQRLDRDRRR